MAPTRWIDLVDPTPEQVREAWPSALHENSVAILANPAPHYGDEPRPRFESHHDYALALLLSTGEVEGEDRVYPQEIDLLLAPTLLLTVRKTPVDGEPFDIDELRNAVRDRDASPGELAYLIVDSVAESYLKVLDDLNDDIDELEDRVEVAPATEIRSRIAGIRHDILHIRRTLAPTRDGVRKVVDNRVEVGGDVELFPHEVELHFGDAYDKLLLATESLAGARDMLGGVRDYYQAKIANDQNEVVKTLTVIASLLLVPTFIVGLYGQNFRRIPELHWGYGYAYSWGLIIGTTLFQLWWFRRKRWI
jgi:magnesium transporter